MPEKEIRVNFDLISLLESKEDNGCTKNEKPAMAWKLSNAAKQKLSTTQECPEEASVPLHVLKPNRDKWALKNSSETHGVTALPLNKWKAAVQAAFINSEAGTHLNDGKTVAVNAVLAIF